MEFFIVVIGAVLLLQGLVMLTGSGWLDVDLKVWVVPTIESDNVKAQEADADEAKNQADKAWRPDEDEPPRASERFFDNPNQSKD